MHQILMLWEQIDQLHFNEVPAGCYTSVSGDGPDLSIWQDLKKEIGTTKNKKHEMKSAKPIDYTGGKVVLKTSDGFFEMHKQNQWNS